MDHLRKKKRYSQQSQIGVFDGELEKPAEVLTWLDDLLTGADIEQVEKNYYGGFLIFVTGNSCGKILSGAKISY